MVTDLTINNIAYSWEDIQIHLGGFELDPIGVSAISYNTLQDHSLVYSRQGFPIARQYGKYESSASMTIDYYEMLKLRKYSSISNYLPLDIKIVYNKENEEGFIDTLYGCRLDFPDELGASQNEMNLETTIILNPVWIHFAVRDKDKFLQTPDVTVFN